jgi:hypothetical protein
VRLKSAEYHISIYIFPCRMHIFLQFCSEVATPKNTHTIPSAGYLASKFSPLYGG